MMQVAVEEAPIQKDTGHPEKIFSGIRSRWPESAVLFVYSALIAFMIPHHEPWADEAQQWMLARSVSLWQLFRTYLHYEGQPGLWHLLLWLLTRVGVGYTGMHWVCGALGVCSVAFLLFCSPFPRWLKLSAPFTAFLFYQYPIVARSYVLAALLIFCVAACWRRGAVPLAILLGLLANTAAHAFALSFGFAVIYVLEIRSKRAEWAGNSQRGRYRVAAVLLLLLYLIAMLTAVPARDINYITSYHTPGQPVAGAIIKFIAGSVVSLFLGTWRSVPVTVIGWFFVVAGLRSRSAAHFLIPVVTFALFCGTVCVGIWHAGLLVPTLLAILWITWPEPGNPNSLGETLMQLSLAALVVLQIAWGLQAYAFDLGNEVSPDLEAAEFLRPYVLAGDQIAVTYVRDTGTQAFHSVGIAPYFPGKLFANQPLPFWWWSRNDATEKNFLSTLKENPQVVLMEDYGLHPAELQAEMNAPKIRLVQSEGYHLTRAFFANVPVVPVGAADHMGLCHLIFVKN